MSSLLPDPSTEFGARVAHRLATETVVWLTVVDGAGTIVHRATGTLSAAQVTAAVAPLLAAGAAR